MKNKTPIEKCSHPALIHHKDNFDKCLSCGKLVEMVREKTPQTDEEIIEKWFNLPENIDMRLPLSCKLSFIDKMTQTEFLELLRYIKAKIIIAIPLTRQSEQERIKNDERGVYECWFRSGELQADKIWQEKIEKIIGGEIQFLSQLTHPLIDTPVEYMILLKSKLLSKEENKVQQGKEQGK